jgi:hypothetical protein
MTTTKTIEIPDEPSTDMACRTFDQAERSLWRKVIDRIADRCRARSLFILHYCTGPALCLFYIIVPGVVRLSYHPL